jgi:hypothetical protein
MPNEQSLPQTTLGLSDRQVVAIRDVIICASDPDDGAIPLEEFRAHPPVGTPPADRFDSAVLEVDLGDGIKLGRVSDDEAERVMNACTPAGQNFAPVRQFGQRYAFYREYSLEEIGEDLYGFDDGGKLGAAIALSRLVRDHGFSYQYAARVIEHAASEPTIRPLAATQGHVAYRLQSGREWLDGPEADGLAALLQAYDPAELPPRISEALWRSEYATRMSRGDIMLFTMVSGLEALLKVGHSQLSRQFKKRASALARDLRVEGVDKDLCERAYDGRSEWVHAVRGSVDIADEKAQLWVEEASKIRDLLRAACRKAIEDPEFRQVFTDDTAIEARWPI